MTSKEEKYEEWRRYFFEVDKEMYEYFTQDLERLEMLEIENDELLDKKLELVVKNKQQDMFIEKLIQENKKLKKIKTNIENKIKFIESCIVTQELNGNEVAIFNLKWQIDILKEVLENEKN